MPKLTGTRDQHRDQRGDQRAVDRRQRAEPFGHRVPASVTEEAEAERRIAGQAPSNKRPDDAGEQHQHTSSAQASVSIREYARRPVRAAQPRGAQREGHVALSGESTMECSDGRPRKTGQRYRIRTRHRAVILADALRFCEGPGVSRALSIRAPQLGPQLPLQPWTWLQLAMIFCFTARRATARSRARRPSGRRSCTPTGRTSAFPRSPPRFCGCLWTRMKVAPVIGQASAPGWSVRIMSKPVGAGPNRRSPRRPRRLRGRARRSGRRC